MVRPQHYIVTDYITDQTTQGDWKKLQSQAGVSDDDLKHFLSYAAQFIGNTGNYKFVRVHTSAVIFDSDFWQVVR